MRYFTWKLELVSNILCMVVDLKNPYSKTGNNKNRENYKKQRRFCTNLLKKNKKSILSYSKYKEPKQQQNVLEKN